MKLFFFVPEPALPTGSSRFPVSFNQIVNQPLNLIVKIFPIFCIPTLNGLSPFMWATTASYLDFQLPASSVLNLLFRASEGIDLKDKSAMILTDC